VLDVTDTEAAIRCKGSLHQVDPCACGTEIGRVEAPRPVRVKQTINVRPLPRQAPARSGFVLPLAARKNCVRYVTRTRAQPHLVLTNASLARPAPRRPRRSGESSVPRSRTIRASVCAAWSERERSWKITCICDAAFRISAGASVTRLMPVELQPSPAVGSIRRRIMPARSSTCRISFPDSSDETERFRRASRSTPRPSTRARRRRRAAETYTPFLIGELFREPRNREKRLNDRRKSAVPVMRPPPSYHGSCGARDAPRLTPRLAARHTWPCRSDTAGMLGQAAFPRVWHRSWESAT